MKIFKLQIFVIFVMSPLQLQIENKNVIDVIGKCNGVTY